MTYFAAFCLGLRDFVSCSWASAGNYTIQHTYCI